MQYIFVNLYWRRRAARTIRHSITTPSRLRAGCHHPSTPINNNHHNNSSHNNTRTFKFQRQAVLQFDALSQIICCCITRRVPQTRSSTSRANSPCCPAATVRFVELHSDPSTNLQRWRRDLVNCRNSEKRPALSPKTVKLAAK